MVTKAEEGTQVAETTAAAPETGAETTQSTVAAPEATQPGAEAQVTKEPEKAEPTKQTYTKAEVDAMTAGLQAETEKHRKANEELLFRRTLEEMQAQEQQAATRDQQAVESGTLTQEQAEALKRARAEYTQLQFQTKQVRRQAEADARVTVINHLVADLSKEYDVPLDVTEFLKDATLVSPDQVEKKALRIIAAKAKETARNATLKRETYDKGPGEGVTGPLPEEQRLARRYPSMFPKK